MRDKNITLYLIYQFLFGLYPIIPIMSLFFLAKGLSFSDIGIIFAVFALTGFLFEIPTGYLGDKFGRRYSVMVGLIILTITAYIFTIISSVLLFSIFGAIWMLGLAFISGSFEGYIYDYLKSIDKEDQYNKLLSQSSAIFYFAGGVGSIIGAYIFSININYPYYLLSILFGLCFVITMFMENDKILVDSNFEDQLKVFSGISYINSHKKVLWLTVFVALLFAFFHYFRGAIDKPYILTLNIFSVEWLGVFVAISMLIQSIFISQFERLLSIFKEKGLIVIYWLISSVPLLLMSVGDKYLALSAVLIYYTSYSFQEQILNSFSQKHIPSKIRATTLSSMKVYQNITGAILSLVAGYLFNIITIRTGLLVAFIYTIIVLIGMYAWKRKSEIEFV